MIHKYTFSIESSTKYLSKLSDFLTKNLTPIIKNKEILDDIIISVDEIATNIIIHAYKKETNHEIRVELIVHSNKIEIILYHTGDTFNPDEVPEPVFSSDPNKRKKGGLGLYIVKKFMDEVIYKFKDKNNKENSVILIKKF